MFAHAHVSECEGDGNIERFLHVFCLLQLGVACSPAVRAAGSSARTWARRHRRRTQKRHINAHMGEHKDEENMRARALYRVAPRVPHC